MKHFMIILFLTFFIIGGCGAENSGNFKIESPVDLINTDQLLSTSTDTTGDDPLIEEITISNITGIVIGEAVFFTFDVTNADECVINFIEFIGINVIFPANIPGIILEDIFVSDAINPNSPPPYIANGIIECMNEIDSNSTEFSEII